MHDVYNNELIITITIAVIIQLILILILIIRVIMIMTIIMIMIIAVKKDISTTDNLFLKPHSFPRDTLSEKRQQATELKSCKQI